MSATPTSQLTDVTRTVTLAKRGTSNTVSLSQTFSVPAEELWAALTSADRLARWFGRASGELQEGGRYELPDMETRGTVTALEENRRLLLTWTASGSSSVMELLLEPGEEEGAEGTTRFTLRHTVPADAHWTAFGPSATGCGWDGALYGLALHLEDPSADVLARLGDFAASAEGAEFTHATADAWYAAHVAAGADRKPARKASVRAAAFYLGEESDLS